jgi:hypothetical protein
MEIKHFTAEIRPEIYGIIDRVKLYDIDDDDVWHLKVATDPVLCNAGTTCANDAVTNYFLSDQAAYQISKYLYCSVGISDASGSDYTLNDLVSPVMTRTATTNTQTTTYTTNDTAQYLAVITCDGDYTLTETGLHTTATSGYMGARQTFYNWSVVNGQRIGAIWEIINTRS